MMNAAKAVIKIKPRAIPISIPAFAPVDSPTVCVAVKRGVVGPVGSGVFVLDVDDAWAVVTGT